MSQGMDQESSLDQSKLFDCIFFYTMLMVSTYTTESDTLRTGLTIICDCFLYKLPIIGMPMMNDYCLYFSIDFPDWSDTKPTGSPNMCLSKEVLFLRN